MIATRSVCVAFSVHGIAADLIGVYESEDLARKRVKQLQNLGLLGGQIEYYNEVLWEESP